MAAGRTNHCLSPIAISLNWSQAGCRHSMIIGNKVPESIGYLKLHAVNDLFEPRIGAQRIVERIDADVRLPKPSRLIDSLVQPTQRLVVITDTRVVPCQSQGPAFDL